MTVDQGSLAQLEDKVSEIVVQSGVDLARVWQMPKEVRYKESADPVTQYDISTEKNLRVELSALLPEAGFIVEEGETTEVSGLNWVIDPIDQTKNFVGQVPLFYTQVCLLENSMPVLAVIYNPVSDQLFSASRGNGAKLNGASVHSAPKESLAMAILDVDFGGDTPSLGWRLEVISRLSKAAFRIRITGGSIAPYLLTGGIDAYVAINEKVKRVDWLPRMILVREAGFIFEEVTVSGHPILVAGPEHVTRGILDVIRQNQT